MLKQFYSRPVLITNLLIGAIGAAGQSLILAHTRIDCYPFKMLYTPPSEVFARIGLVAGLLSPVLAMGLLYLIKPKRESMICAIPVVVCPAIFWLIYNAFFFVSGYTYARAIDTNKDFMGTDAMGHEFAYQVISLTGKGLLTGLGCGILVSLLFRLKRKDNYSSPIGST